MKPSDEDLKKAVDMLIRQEIQENINDYVDTKDTTKKVDLDLLKKMS